jgi:alpha-L-fucosidase
MQLRNLIPTLALIVLTQMPSLAETEAPRPIFTPVNQLPEEPDPTRVARMQWWREARFGMFIHYGPYAVRGHGEWAMQQEHIPAEEYTPLADSLRTRPEAVREWARAAKAAGARYMVLTAKHCDGFQLWDTAQTEFNSVKRGPKRDLVAEFVKACRDEGLKVGLYYSLMDWRHPDGDRCAIDEEARKRFVAFTHANVRELMANYGKIDVLWFDGPWPMPTPEQWESRALISMVRSLQPDIIINNRARLAEDFSTPEGSVAPQNPGRAWEACMTFNGDWGYSNTPEGDWHSARDVLRMLRTATAFGGNLLLNIGPRADGSFPPEATPRLKVIGDWLKSHGEAVYGDITRLDGKVEAWVNTGFWTLRGNTGYYWLLRGDPSPNFSIARVEGQVTSVTVLHTGKPVHFTQEATRLKLEGVPPLSDEPSAQSPVLKVEFATPPRQVLGAGMLILPDDKAAWW